MKAEFWVPFCAALSPPIDPFSFDADRSAVQVTNCFAAVNKQARDAALRAGRPAQHSAFKDIRAAVNAIWLIVHPEGAVPDLSKVHSVASTAVGLRKTQPMLSRYQDSWDPHIVFGYIYALASTGVWIKDMPQETFSVLSVQVLIFFNIFFLRKRK